jgi:superfamily II DNA or RNA helicase
MGLGKTLCAIMAMRIVKDDPGFSMVVAPKVLCQQWVDQIEGAFEEVIPQSENRVPRLTRIRVLE